MAITFVKARPANNDGEGNVSISGRKLAELCHVSNGPFFEAIRNRTIIPQLVMPKQENNPYVFSPEYAKEIIPLFPKKRTKGSKVFTAELKDKLKQINKRWEKKTIVTDF